MVERAVVFPPGQHYALTWGIPDDFAGMTSALLHRSRAFVRLAGVHVTILTFETRPDYPAIEQRLRDRGELVDGMHLVNLWEWLRDALLDAADTIDLASYSPLADTGHTEAGREGRVLTRTRVGSAGDILQVDHYRTDGTLVASDRRDVTEPGVLGGRSIVLCDASGTPVRSFGGAWALYRWWLDQLRQRRPSFMIVDSKTVAPFAMTYKRKRAVMLHLVHNSHTQQGGDLRESRREVFEHLDRFDSVVVLTEHQRQDVAATFGDRPNLSVIPNSRPLSDRARSRGRHGGIALATLTPRKRVDHAMLAASAAGSTLDVFGAGDPEPFAALAHDGVRLRGYSPHARDELRRASYILLTGRSEGFPLALVEAMAAGCIPIAYDVDYGPSSIIRPGRNGMLVPSGDVDALAAAIRKFQAMPRPRVELMRWNARRTAAAFSDEAVTRQWAREFRQAAERKAAAWAAEHA